MDGYRAYLSLLEETGIQLDKLSELAREKTAAVRTDNLTALDGVMRQEQAISLALRGLESKRLAQAAELNMEGVRLSQTAAFFPSDLQIEARRTAEELLRRYQIYQSAAEVARNTLECNLHEIEKILRNLGAEPDADMGYTPPDLQPPTPMKTDFRA